MNELAATWPFSDAEDFQAFIIVVSLMLAGVGVLAATMVAQVLDGPVRTVDNTDGASASSSSSPLSLPVTAGLRHERLVVGRLPRADELWLVAWLRGGRRRLEATLYVAARRAGWLQVDANDRLDVVMDVVDPADPLLARFKTAVARTIPTSKRPVHDAGADLGRLVVEEAIEAGVKRPLAHDLLLQGIAMAGGLVVLALLVVRTVLSQSGYLKPGVEQILAMPSLMVWLPFLLMGYGAVAIGGIAFVLSQHRQAAAYLRWLDGVVDAIRADVRAGVDVRDEDLLLVTALDGEYRLGRGGERVRIDLIHPAPLDVPERREGW